MAGPEPGGIEVKDGEARRIAFAKVGVDRPTPLTGFKSQEIYDLSLVGLDVTLRVAYLEEEELGDGNIGTQWEIAHQIFERLVTDHF